jgi:predicted RNA-binding Zn-ribbon protein involved in translation (DUF1610 family)
MGSKDDALSKKKCSHEVMLNHMGMHRCPDCGVIKKKKK